ncbi:hypothetical protein BSKO_13935 [Bryopsis sp. KO-2023]|nr:hypothetical protein BSKO_13935 [Bryopsis sp. KO-2023]
MAVPGAAAAPPNRLVNVHFPTFHGKEKEDVSTWIKQYEVLAIGAGWQMPNDVPAHEDQRIERLILYTADKARSWVDNWETSHPPILPPGVVGGGNPNPARTWQNMRAALLARFGSEPSTLMKKLVERRQTASETANEFAQDLEALRQHMMPILPSRQIRSSTKARCTEMELEVIKCLWETEVIKEEEEVEATVEEDMEAIEAMDEPMGR